MRLKIRKRIKHLLITTIAAVVLVGCGPSVDIHQAAEEGNIEAVKQHIAAGTDVNAKDDLGLTPLHEAAEDGHKEIAELLIAGSAEVNAKNEDGYTPLLSAVGLLANHARSLGIVELLIAKGADLSVKTKHGQTALVLATATGQRDVVELLIEKGAAINANGDFDGATALHVACTIGKREIAELLINTGADINVRDLGGATPLQRAIYYDNHGYITDGVERTNLSDLLRKHGGKTELELIAEGN
jgi:ankyrin repeat protein